MSQTDIAKDHLLSALGCSDLGHNESIQANTHLAKSRNFIHYISNSALGRPSFMNKKAVIDTCVMSCLSNCEMTTREQPFSSRVTTIDWHPCVHSLICIGSRHGGLKFYLVGHKGSNLLQNVKSFSAIGPGGCITAFKFHPVDNEKFFTSSFVRVCMGNLEKQLHYTEKILLNRGHRRPCLNYPSMTSLFSSMDVHQTDNMIVAGHNDGWTTLMSRTGEMIWNKQLHRSEVSHLEFSPHEPHLLCSASHDCTVRIWDVRMVVDEKPLDCLLHEVGISSAYFSLTDGTRLLTTDRHDEIRVYRAPFWQMETCIKHPHHLYEPITPIKATWHPVNDNIICGRYLNVQDYSAGGSIDVFDASTGKMDFQLEDDEIVSLCKFNKTGDKLLSAMSTPFLGGSIKLTQMIR